MDDKPAPNKTTLMLLQVALGVIVVISAFVLKSGIEELSQQKTSIAEIRVTQTAVITAQVELAKELSAMKTITAAIQVSQATLMTNADGLAIWTEIARIQKELSGKANASDIPSPEVLRRFERNERQIEDLQNALRNQERK